MSEQTKTVVGVEIEERQRYTATVDVDALIAAFPDEWAAFMRGDEPSNDDKTEFVKETIDEMGTKDFFFPGSSPWVMRYRDEDEIDVVVKP